MGRFRVNPLGVNAVKSSPQARRWAQEAADAVAAEAKRTAPVRTGNYRRSIKPTVLLTKDGWIGRVNAFDFKANWVELGTHGIRKRRVLGSALDVVGPTARLKGK